MSTTSTPDVTLHRADCFDLIDSLPKVGACITDPPIKVYWRDIRCRLAYTDWLDKMRKIATTVMFTVSEETADDFPPPSQVVMWRWRVDSRIFVYGLSADLPDLIEESWPEQEAFEHGSCKPLPLLRRLVAATRGTVIDPFIGTGTTGVACVEQGRPFVGIEVDERHFETARQRINNVR